MSWFQKTINLRSKSRGCHLITREIEKQVPEIEQYEIGMANIFRKSIVSIYLILVKNFIIIFFFFP